MLSLYSVEEIDAQHKSLQIRDSINERSTKCTFLTQDDVKEWDEISVETIFSEVLFAGIANRPTYDKANNMTTTVVNVVGYKKIFDRMNVGQSYEDMTAGAIVKSIIQNYCPGFYGDVTNIEDGPTLEKVVFSWVLPSEAINRIARAVGYSWYIDFDKKVHFFAKNTTAAPRDITEDTTYHESLKIDVDISNLVNQVVVRGGTYQSVEQEYFEVGDGEKQQFILPEKPQDITVYVDSGSGYTEKTLGILFEGETPTTDFVVNYHERYIQNGTHATLTSSDTLKVTFKYQAPIRVKRQNLTSIEAIKAQFPLLAPDGIIEKVVDDNKIDSRDLAYELADQELEAYSNPVISGTFKTHENLFSKGEVISINTNEYVGDAIIQQITSKNLGGPLWQHTVRFDTVLYDFEDFMRELFASRKIELITNEVLETIHNFTDNATFSDSATISKDENQQSEAFTVSDDNYLTLNKSVTYVLGPYFPSSYTDSNRQFLLDSSPMS